MPVPALISALARSLMAEEPTVDGVHARLVRTLGRPWRWLEPLARRYVAAFSGHTRPRHRDVVRFLLDDQGFKRARIAHGNTLSIAEWIPEPQRMHPVAAALRWDLPPIETSGDLAAWLSLYPTELEWFADLKGLGYKINNPKLQHYYYSVQTKRSGGVRLIESPKPDMKQLQRRILSAIIDRIPAHPAVHGFVKGRSVVTFASPHVGQQVLLRLDLQDFFPSFPGARAQAMFRTLGYPEPVADSLGGICTNAVPGHVWRNRPLEIGAEEWRQARVLYARPHLPQGAPTSPALANIMAFRLDCRLTGLARTAGAVYTRYADDLAFSGGEDFGRIVDRFLIHAAAIALEEGFSVNHRKTRIMRQGVRQHLAGIVVNRKINLRRRDLEVLEATLINCVRHGPGSQNRAGVLDFRAHLAGRIGYVEMIDSAKAQRLRAIFEMIEWEL